MLRPFLPLLTAVLCILQTDARPLKLHAVFTDHMVLQRDKPIVIWGWADPGDQVTVTFGDQSGKANAVQDTGRWEVTFPARPGGFDPLTLNASSGEEKVSINDILIGDVWIANGQSNMAWALDKTTHSDFERTQAHLPGLRHLRLQTNEQETLQTDLPDEVLINGGWEVSTPETCLGFSAIGYHFGSRLQKALQVPIGIISNARGGASLESLVPAHKFDDHPVAKKYAESVDQRRAEFDLKAKGLEKWERELKRAQSKKVPEDKWPPKPVNGENLRSWDIPGKSPSDRASVYNGMFGVFKGLNIKGVIFHQGFNNALNNNCRPKRYRILMKLMIEGWREDFNDPDLAVGIIGFCAGGETQNDFNFEEQSIAGGPYIREAQRLGVADAGNPEHTAFLPAYDVQVPGLHPFKKRDHGVRAARWALSKIYQFENMFWETALPLSVKPEGDEIVVTFETKVQPDDKNRIPTGFSIAGNNGKFYRAHARFQAVARNQRSEENKIIRVWSPLVPEPVAIRYGWATSPMGNLKINAHPDCPVSSFRTDQWDWPESDDPTEILLSRSEANDRKKEAAERGIFRRTEEAKRAVEILERVQQLGAIK